MRNSQAVQSLSSQESKVLFSVTIPGRPYIKKNQQKIINRGGTYRAVYSSQYLAWEKTAILSIRQRRPFSAISFPVNMKAIFYFENRQGECDLSNLYEGVQDILVKEGVLEDDRFIFGHDGSTKLFGHEPRVEVEILTRGNHAVQE